MKKIIVALIIFIFFSANAFATWSIIMIALEAGSTSGGDKRCGEQKASSAFIIVAKPDDKKPYINLNIFGQRKGGQNAVEMLLSCQVYYVLKKIPTKEQRPQRILLCGLSVSVGYASFYS